MFKLRGNGTSYAGLSNFNGYDEIREELGLPRFLPPDASEYVDSAEIYVDIQASGTDLFAGTYVDAAEVYVDIQPSGVDDHDIVYTDSAEVYVDIQASGVDSMGGDTTDAATILVDIQPSGIDVFPTDYVDAATVLLDISIDSHDCLIRWAPTWLGTKAFNKWTATVPLGHKWTGEASHKWTATLGYGIEEEC